MNLKCYLVLFLINSFWGNIYGQDSLQENLVADSIIQQFKIKKITQDWFGNLKSPEVFQTTIEDFDTIGRIIHRTYINYTYHKSLTKFVYHKKKQEIKTIRKFYDWNPYREKRPKDTIISKSTERYDLNTKYPKKYKAKKRDQFQTQLRRDSLHRLVERIDSIKWGYQTTKYVYDQYNQLVEQRSYITRRSDAPALIAIDHFTYNAKKQLIKEISYQYFTKVDEEWIADKEVEITYKYNSLKLLEEKKITNRFLNLEKAKPSTSLYKLSYEFH